ncbi:hypothetical protein D3C86_1310580 [compost metagenome]
MMNNNMHTVIILASPVQATVRRAAELDALHERFPFCAACVAEDVGVTAEQFMEAADVLTSEGFLTEGTDYAYVEDCGVYHLSRIGAHCVCAYIRGHAVNELHWDKLTKKAIKKAKKARKKARKETTQ